MLGGFFWSTENKSNFIYTSYSNGIHIGNIMLSQYDFKHAPLAMRQRWASWRHSTSASVSHYLQATNSVQQERLREDLCWLIQHMPVKQSYREWIDLGVELIRLSFPCLHYSDASEAAAYFAKAADNVYWCSKSVWLEKNPDYFISEVYLCCVRCAQSVNDKQTVYALDNVILALCMNRT